MPNRLSVKTVPTPTIQGDDSYIKYRPITMNEARDLREKTKEIENKRTKALADYSAKINKPVADFTEDETNLAFEYAGLTDEVLNFIYKEFSKFILEWNWVDDDGKPLAQPNTDYKVLGVLYSHEYNFILNLFNPQDTEKN